MQLVENAAGARQLDIIFLSTVEQGSVRESRADVVTATVRAWVCKTLRFSAAGSCCAVDTERLAFRTVYTLKCQAFNDRAKLHFSYNADRRWLMAEAFTAFVSSVASPRLSGRFPAATACGVWPEHMQSVVLPVMSEMEDAPVQAIYGCRHVYGWDGHQTAFPALCIYSGASESRKAASRTQIVRLLEFSGQLLQQSEHLLNVLDLVIQRVNQPVVHGFTPVLASESDDFDAWNKTILLRYNMSNISSRMENVIDLLITRINTWDNANSYLRKSMARTQDIEFVKATGDCSASFELGHPPDPANDDAVKLVSPSLNGETMPTGLTTEQVKSLEGESPFSIENLHRAFVGRRKPSAFELH
jgi:hypothetical protein